MIILWFVRTQKAWKMRQGEQVHTILIHKVHRMIFSMKNVDMGNILPDSLESLGQIEACTEESCLVSWVLAVLVIVYMRTCLQMKGLIPELRTTLFQMVATHWGLMCFCLPLRKTLEDPLVQSQKIVQVNLRCIVQFPTTQMHTPMVEECCIHRSGFSHLYMHSGKTSCSMDCFLLVLVFWYLSIIKSLIMQFFDLLFLHACKTWRICAFLTDY